MSIIYRWQSPGHYTGWDYRIDIMRSGGAYLDAETATVVELPFEVLKIKSGDKGFDKLLFGVEKVPQMEFEIDLNKLPIMSPDVYDEFQEAVLTPEKMQIVTAPVHDNIKATTYDVDTGTIYRYYIKFNTEMPGVDYILIGTYIQLTGYDDIDSLKRDKLTIKADHWLKIAINNIDFGRIYEVVPEKTAAGVIDYLYHNISTAAFGHTYSYGDGAYFGFVSFYTFIVWINTTLTAIGKVVCRDADKACILSLEPNITYFKQTYDGTGSLGASLMSPSYYFLATIIKDGISQGGYLDVYRQSGSLFGDYSNLLDYLTELFDEGLTKLQFTEIGFAANSISNENSMVKTLDLDMVHQQNLTVRKNYANIGNVVSALSESMGDDITNYEVQTKYGKKDYQYSIPICHGNLPTAAAYNFTLQSPDLATKMNMKPGDIVNYEKLDEFSGRQSDFYYFENSSDLCVDTGVGLFVKVHKFCRYKLRESTLIESDDYAACALELMALPTLTNEIIKTFLFDYQLDQNKPMIAAEAVKAMFMRKMAPIEFELPFYHFRELFAGDVALFGYPAVYTGYRVNFDLSPWRAKYASLPANLSVANAKFDYENEVVTLVLIPEIE